MYAVCPSPPARRALPALLVLLVAVLTVALAPAAWAVNPNTATITSNDPSPVAGSPATFTAETHSDCTRSSFTFAVDGTAQPPTQGDPNGHTATVTTTFATPGNHTVSVHVVFQSTGGAPGSCGTADETTTFAIGAGVSGTITTNPDPARPGEATILGVTPSGGLGNPYVGYRWTIDGVPDPAGNGNRSYARTFTAGRHTIVVTFSDDPADPNTNPQHSGSSTRTIDVEVAPPPAPGAPPAPPAPPAPACTRRVDFALSELKTSGCFTKTGSSPDVWTTTDQVRLNGIAFADSGQQIIITGPTAAEPGGHIKSNSAAIQLDRFIPFSGNMDWSLPAGRQGDEGTLTEVAVPAFARLFKLRVAGSIAIKLGWRADGTHYAAFPLNVELPPAFTAGPSKFSGGVSGAASISVDDNGIHYDGLKISVTDVWVGSLRIASACFSYVPAGGQAVAPCAAPELDGRPYIECATDVTTDRFDGSAVIELPTASSTRLAAFGGLAGGQVSNLGGFADDLGTTVPIVPGVFLNRVGVGLCLSPPPFKLRGDVGVNALGGKLTVNGHVTYTDATDSSPWSVDVGGSVAFNGTQLGDATVGFNAWGDVNFDVNAALRLGEVASITGNVNGWIEPRNSSFTVSGSVKGCIEGLPCAQATALVSNVGIAGCLDLGSYTIDVPSNARQGPFGFGSIQFTTRKQTFHLQAGVGYRYGGRVDLLGGSCDLSPYASARSATSARAAAAGRFAARVRAGAQAVTLRLHGTDGPPKVVVRGPGGATITSPAGGRGVQQKGRYVLAENTSDGTTSVLLIRPAAGTWTVAPAPGAASRPTRIDRADFQAPSVLFGQVRMVGDRRQAAVQYAVPDGASVRLVERGRGIGRTLVTTVRGTRCRGTRALPDGRVVRCAKLTFTPSAGPGGVRQLQAVVTRGGFPLARRTIASFTVPREAAPSRPGALRARRVGRDVVVAFPKTRGASRYTATAVLDDGRRLGFDLAGSCRAVRIPAVAADDAVRFKVAGVRYDLRTGAYARITLARNRRSAGGGGTLPRRACR